MEDIQKQVEESQVSDEMKPYLFSVLEKFEVLKELASGVASGHIQALVTRGAPGIGKSYTILDHLRSKHVRGSKDPIRMKHMSGHITPMQTYKTLADHRDAKSVVIFDDCDSVFTEANSLNILKAACDTGKFRTVSWNSSKVAEESFDFEGGLIILSNADFRSVHYAAFIDRVHLYDMEVTNQEKVAKIWHTAMGMGDVKPAVANEVCQWLLENQTFVEYLSMRTFYKVAQLTKLSKDWKRLATHTIFKNELRKA